MKNKLLAVGVVGLMMLAGFGMLNAEARGPPKKDIMQVEAENGCVDEVDLIAGQNMDVGNVTVETYGDYLMVTYEILEPDWYLLETHLHIGYNVTDIPHTKKGNPIPGQFDFTNESHDPLTTEYTWYVNYTELGFEPYDRVKIAAHAVVYHVLADCIDIVSDNTTLVEDGNNITATYPYNAVEAWEPGPAYPNDGPDDSSWEANSLWDNNVGYDFDAVGAEWIWEEYRVIHPVLGDIVNFSKTFDIPGMYPISLMGMVHITCDNGYELYVNDDFMGSAQVFGDWIHSDLTQAYVDTSNWQSVEHWNISGNLTMGTNELFIPSANEEMTAGTDGHRADGTQSSNPGGLIYYASVCYEVVDMEETAWADGERFTRRGNWGTYFEYEIVPPILVGGFNSVRSRGPLGGYLAEELFEKNNFGCGGTVSRPIKFIPFVDTIENESLVDSDGNLLCHVFFAPLTTTVLTTDEANETMAFLEAGGILYLSGNSNPLEGASYTPLFTALGWADVYTGGWSGNNGDVSSMPVSTPITTGPFGTIGNLTHTPFDPISTSTATIVATGVNASHCLVAEASVGSNGGYLSMTGDPIYFDMFVDPGGSYYDIDNLNYFLNLFALAE